MSLCALVVAEWRLKLGIMVFLNVLFLLGYGTLSRQAYFPEVEMPMTWVDRWVRYSPVPWAGIYLSQFLHTGTLPFLLSDRSTLMGYDKGVLVMFLPSFLVFLFFPVALPRGAEVSSDPFMQWIIRHDGRFNCFPSLHAAFLAYSSGLAWRMFGKAWSGWVIGLVGVWGGLILYSTLATKQHYAWDLVAGLVLGWIACVVAWRGAPENSIEITARMRDSTAHEGLR